MCKLETIANISYVLIPTDIISWTAETPVSTVSRTMMAKMLP